MAQKARLAIQVQSVLPVLRAQPEQPERWEQPVQRAARELLVLRA